VAVIQLLRELMDQRRVAAGQGRRRRGGYANASALSHAFKERIGVPPIVWLDRHGLTVPAA